MPCRGDYDTPCGNAVSDLKRDKSTPVLVSDDMDEADEEFLTMAMENIETEQTSDEASLLEAGRLRFYEASI